MSAPNRLKVYYRFWCHLCYTEQHRGSSAKWCNLTVKWKLLTVICLGRLQRISREPVTRRPRIAE